MRKKISLSLTVVGLSLLIASCKKEHARSTVDEQLLSKVSLWLDAQKVPTKPNKAASIELLKNNLDFAKSWAEDSDGGEQILIVPANENYKELRKIDLKTIANLVLIFDKNGKIRRGNLVLYTAKDKNLTTVPKNTFYDIYNTAEPAASGEFKFLGVDGRWLYQLNYDNKTLKSIGLIQAKSQVGGRLGDVSVAACIDWYLITTFYDENGNVIYTTSDYVGRTCSGCDDGMNEGFCPNNEGGGSTETDYEYAKAVSKTWKVADDPDNPTSNRKIWSTDRIRYKLVATEPEGGHFTTPENWSHPCDFCGYTDSWDPQYMFSQATPQIQKVDVHGNLFYDARVQTVSNNISYTMASMPH